MLGHTKHYCALLAAALFIGGCSGRSGVDYASRENFELKNTYQDILSVTVSAPTKGYVVLTGSGYTKLIRRGGTTWITLSVGLNSGGSNTEHETAVELPAGVGPNTEFTLPFSITGVIPVEAGERKFYLVGIKDPNPGTSYINAAKLTAVFIEQRL